MPFDSEPRYRELLPAQMDFVADVTTPILGITSGIGGGKTFVMCEKGIRMADLNQTVPGTLCMPTYPMIEDVLVDTLDDALAWHDIDYHAKRSHPMKYTLDMPLGETEIRLRSGSDPKKAASGSNLGWAGIDETDQTSEELVMRMRGRIRHPRAGYKQLFLGGTPEGRLILYKIFKGSPLVTRAGEALTRLIQSRTIDNIHLDQFYLETAFAGMDEFERAQFMNGEFVLPRGRVYRQLKDRHIRRCINPLEGRLVMMADFNVSPMSWFLGRIVGDELHVWGELVRNDTDTIEHTREVAGMWSKLLSAQRGYFVSPYEAASEVEVYCDASGKGRRTSSSKSDVEHLRAAGFRMMVASRNPPIKDRVFSVNKRAGMDRFFIDPVGAPECAKCFQNQEWGKDGFPDKKKGLDHAPDAVGYLVHYEWPAEYSRGNKTNYVVAY